MKNKLYNFINNYIHNVDIAQDIYQDTMMKSFLYNITGSNSGSWMYTVAKNASFTYLTSRKFHKDLDDNSLKSEPAGINFGDKNNKKLHNAIDRLSPKYQDIIKLKYFENLRYKEIAIVLNINPKTAAWRCHIARVKLKEIIIGG